MTPVLVLILATSLLAAGLLRWCFADVVSGRLPRGHPVTRVVSWSKVLVAAFAAAGTFTAAVAGTL